MNRERLTSSVMLIILVVTALSIGWLCCYQTAPNFSNFPSGDERKTVFMSYFAPLIKNSNERILQQRHHVLKSEQAAKNDELGWLQQWRLTIIAKHYGVDDFDIRSDQQWSELLLRVDIIPASMAIAQAAKESAWGTSRFAQAGNNFFGQWCYEEGCGLVPARRESGKAHEVETFASPEDSVREYMHNLNTNRAYRALREIRRHLREAKQPIKGERLVQGLISYSERGEIYVNELSEMIRFNQLEKFDMSELKGTE